MIQNISIIITSLTWVYRAWDIDWVLTGPSQQDSLKLLLRSESPKSFVPYPIRQKDNTVFGAVFFSTVASNPHLLCNKSIPRDSVSSGYPKTEKRNTPQIGLFFTRNSRCLDSQWKNVSSVRYIYSIETKPKDFREKSKSSKSTRIKPTSQSRFTLFNLMTWAWNFSFPSRQKLNRSQSCLVRTGVPALRSS